MKTSRIIFVLLLVSLSSCGQRIPKKYKALFDKCCTIGQKNINLTINTNGFFDITWIYKVDSHDIKGNRILFYENGLCVNRWGGYAPNPQEFLDEVIAQGGESYFFRNAAWGCYEIHGDTIVVRSIVPGTLMRPVEVWETHYKVINKNSIQQIFYAHLENKNKKTPLKDETDKDIVFLGCKFISLTRIPDAKYSWLYQKIKCK